MSGMQTSHQSYEAHASASTSPSGGRPTVTLRPRPAAQSRRQQRQTRAPAPSATVQAWLTINRLHLWARALATENVSCATIYLKYLFNNHTLSLYHYYQSLRCANAYTDICTTPYEHAHTLTTGKSYSAITCNVEKHRRARPKHPSDELAILTTCGKRTFIAYGGGD